MGLLPVALAGAFVGGVSAGALVAFDLALSGMATSFLLSAVAVTAWRRRRWYRVTAAAGVLGVAAWGAVLGNDAVARAVESPLETWLGTRGLLSDDAARPTVPVRLEGRLTTDASPVGRSTALRMTVRRVWSPGDAAPFVTPGTVWLTVAGEAAAAARKDWCAGRTVAVVAAVRRASTFRNPGAADPRHAAAQRRGALVGSVKSALVVEVVAHGRWWEEAAARMRAQARLALGRATAGDSAAAAVGAAVLIGDRAGLSRELEERLQRAGTFHVIAISGGNIAVWALVVTWVVSRATLRPAIAGTAVVVALVGYAGLVGGGASVLRATGMALCGVATRWLDQRAAAINVLALTSGLLVAADPLLVFEVGFWLTTGATAGIVLAFPAPAGGQSGLRTWVRSLVLAGVAAEVALLPMVAFVFQQVTLAGVLLSIVAVPAIAIVQLSALAVVVLDVASPTMATPPGLLLQWSTLGVTGSAHLVDVWPWLAWKVPPPSWPEVAGYYAAIVAVTAAPGMSQAPIAWVKRGGLTVAAGLAVWIAVSPATLGRRSPRSLSITVFDVGQGDATLLEFPSGHRMLVDAGGVLGDGRDLGSRVVGPALRALGHRRLDTLVVTHADLDHIGGAVSLAREFRPNDVWTGIHVAGHAPSAALRQVTDEIGAAWREVRRDERVTFGGVELRVLHPDRPDWERQRVRNDDSVVLELRHGRVRVVLAGDISREVEAVLVDQGALASPDRALLTLLKVAHHGSHSATSDVWLTALRPRMAVLSAGATNSFGHPSPAVLARLTAAGAEVWRTDRDGAITVRSDGHALDVVAASGRHARVRPRRRRGRAPGARRSRLA